MVDKDPGVGDIQGVEAHRALAGDTPLVAGDILVVGVDRVLKNIM